MLVLGSIFATLGGAWVIAPEPSAIAYIPQDNNTTAYVFANGIAGICFESETPPPIVRTYVPLRVNGRFVKKQ